MQRIPEQLSQDLQLPLGAVENVIALLAEGNTIPFIARYRKESHGSLDDTQLRALEERFQYLKHVATRREEMLRSIEGQGKLTQTLIDEIDKANTLVDLEDIYRPYKQKRRTRASMAKEKGLEPLATLLYAQGRDLDLPALTADYLNPDMGLDTPEAVLAGASDIVAEWISEDPGLRKKLRQVAQRQGSLSTKVLQEDDAQYSLYHNVCLPLHKLQGHQILALNRGEREGILKISVGMEESKALEIIRRTVVIPGSPVMALMKAITEDAYDRLLEPSLERELRSSLTDMAAEGAIKVFALNLKALLLQPPIKGKITLGLDPAYRTGCKLAVVDETGKVLDTAVIYPTQPHNKVAEAKAVVTTLIRHHGVQLISIGNGTASRESEQFIAQLLKEIPEEISYAIVNEAGASVYSASKLAAEEFPQYDVSLRSAVSIARRLQDPLAELVKIDPKSIGVGQYQHDMPQNHLSDALEGVVEDCVNAVGVDLNTASPSLLARVAGLGATTAGNIVKYREANGSFRERVQLLKVPKLGPKSYQQCAGFLRLPDSSALLERTGVHPESYTAAERLLVLCGYDLASAQRGEIGELSQRVSQLGEERVALHCQLGIPTLRDLIGELLKPGRDIRDELAPPVLRSDVLEMKDLMIGMQLRGTVRNVIDFGAFVDIGVHQDGLVHVSEISNRFIRHPSEILSVGDIVDVVVLAVEQKRISLSIKQADALVGK